MKNIWKWILGGVILLVVAAGLFGLGFVWRTRMMATPVAIQSSAPNPPQWHGPMWGQRDGRMMPPGIGPMRGFGRGAFMPGMMLFGLFGILGRLIPLGLLLLLLYVAYQMGKGRSAPVPVAPVVAAPVTPESVAPVPATPTHLCPACNAAVQDDWKHCPNCGEKQA